MRMTFSIEKISDKVIHFNYFNKVDLFLSFMRMSEFYESPSPKLNGQFFTTEELIYEYSKLTPSKTFTYMDDWKAFNIPGKTINEFVELYGNSVSEWEKSLIQAIAAELLTWTSIEDYYFIGTYGNADQDIDLAHEVAHALFTTNKDYRRDMKKLISSKSFPKKEVFKQLAAQGYGKKVLLDEAQAYLATLKTQDDLEILNLEKFNKKQFIDFNLVYKKYTSEVPTNGDSIRD